MRKNYLKHPQFIDIHKEISNIFLMRGQQFWDNKCFKSYEEKHECLDFTEKMMTSSI